MRWTEEGAELLGYRKFIRGLIVSGIAPGSISLLRSRGPQWFFRQVSRKVCAAFASLICAGRRRKRVGDLMRLFVKDFRREPDGLSKN